MLHRDLKPENGASRFRLPSTESPVECPFPLTHCLPPVFMSDDFVKLGDFGLSKDMGTSAFTSTYVGVRPRPGFSVLELNRIVDTAIHAARDPG